MRAILTAVMMWATLSGGAGGMPLRDGLVGRGYVSSWTGERISAQAMRHVW